jgi:hypothetical protein
MPLTLDDLAKLIVRFIGSDVPFRLPAPPFDSPAVFETLGLHLEVPVDVRLGAATERAKSPAHEVVPFTFPSRTITEWPECNTVHGELLLLSGRPPAPICVLIHGNGEGSPFLERWRGRQLLAAGVHAAWFCYAHHMQRIPAGEKRAGHSVSPDLHGSVQTFVQAAGDAADLVRWLRRQPFVTAAGISGTSGGGLANLLAITLTHLDFSLPIVPGVTLAHPLWSPHFPGYERIRANVASEEALAEAVCAVDVKRRRPIPPSRWLTVAGRYDEVCGVDATRTWWESWGRPPIDWVNHGHLAGGMLGNRKRLVWSATARTF